MALRVTIGDDTFARRWVEGTFVRVCIHNATDAVVSLRITGSSPASGTAVFENRAELRALIAELQELEAQLGE